MGKEEALQLWSRNNGSNSGWIGEWRLIESWNWDGSPSPWLRDEYKWRATQVTSSQSPKGILYLSGTSRGSVHCQGKRDLRSENWENFENFFLKKIYIFFLIYFFFFSFHFKVGMYDWENHGGKIARSNNNFFFSEFFLIRAFVWLKRVQKHINCHGDQFEVCCN